MRIVIWLDPLKSTLTKAAKRIGQSSFTSILISLVALTFLPYGKVFSQTKESPRSDSSVSFAVIGDYGSDAQGLGADERSVANMVKSWNPDFIITLGDNNYPKGSSNTMTQNISKYYCDYIYNPGAVPQPCSGRATTQKRNLFFPTLGNHDWCAKHAKPYTEYFTQLPGNRRYYDFVIGPVHFFALDSQSKEACTCRNPDCSEPDGADEDSEQAQWLKNKLKESKSAWKIVYFHHAPYTCKKASKWMRWPFQTWGANAVLSGHKHVYERGWLSSAKNFPYFVNGVGGTKLSECSAKDIKQNSRSAKFEEIIISGYYGAMRVEASPDTIKFRFHRATDRKVMDECELRKTQNGQELDCRGASKARKIAPGKKEIGG
jgi:tartrate-resistant acid phosphatase type 5